MFQWPYLRLSKLKTACRSVEGNNAVTFLFSAVVFKAGGAVITCIRSLQSRCLRQEVRILFISQREPL